MAKNICCGVASHLNPYIIAHRYNAFVLCFAIQVNLLLFTKLSHILLIMIVKEYFARRKGQRLVVSLVNFDEFH